jgi:hypothetical protein
MPGALTTAAAAAPKRIDLLSIGTAYVLQK